MKKYRINECGDAAGLTPEDIETLKAIIAKIDGGLGAEGPECVGPECDGAVEEPIEGEPLEVGVEGEDIPVDDIPEDDVPVAGDGEYAVEPNDGIDPDAPVVFPSLDDLPDVDEEDPDKTAYY